ncbi:MAG: hypothetical protein ACI90V_012602, partial [Bacillariaceae sp.]
IVWSFTALAISFGILDVSLMNSFRLKLFILKFFPILVKW